MKKQTKQQEVIDLDSFNDISLFQMIPSGSGMGLSHLKTIVDSVHNGKAKLNSLLITGKEGLQTHSSAFLRALGITDYNQIDGSLLQLLSGIHQFFCAENHEAYIISNTEKIPSIGQLHITNILTKKKLCFYNYLKEGLDTYDVPGLVIMTSKNMKKVPAPILDAVDHIVRLEDYTTEQLELIILQRLKYARIDYENEYILQDIVRYGHNDLKQSIRFLSCCIAVMQSQDRQKLDVEDVIKSARLNRLNDMGDDILF